MMTISQSIRWRLPLSYAAIAFIAALALGVVLLTTLRNFYSQAEITYLRNNAEAIGAMITRFAENPAFNENIEEQLQTFSFLSQTRVQLLDIDNNVIQDTGLPDDSVLTFDRRIRSFGGDVTGPGVDYETFSGNPEIRTWILALNAEDISPVEESSDPVRGFTIEVFSKFDEDTQFIVEDHIARPTPIGSFPDDNVLLFPARRTLFGFDLNNTQNSRLPIRRSNQVIELSLPTESAISGFIKLSQGPAYGAEIVDSVAQGWLIASIIAVVLAALVGLYISQRLTTPLLTLTHATTQMTAGDLTARAMVMSHDEVGLLAQSFNKMASRVEETIVTLRHFVADAAHELHTPLTALRTNLELIASEPHDQQRFAFIKQAQSQVQRLEALTTDLLELSRLEAITPTAQKGAMNLTHLIQATSEIYASQAEQLDIHFDLELPQSDILVVGDAIQIQRAIGNLLDNALKFTPTNGLIRLGLSQYDNRTASIWVEDTGIGIPAEDLPLIFSRFHRGRNAAAYSGSGLGLAIVKAIADTHCGVIAVQPLSNGTRFALNLTTI